MRNVLDARYRNQVITAAKSADLKSDRAPIKRRNITVNTADPARSPTASTATMKAAKATIGMPTFRRERSLDRSGLLRPRRRMIRRPSLRTNSRARRAVGTPVTIGRRRASTL